LRHLSEELGSAPPGCVRVGRTEVGLDVPDAHAVAGHIPMKTISVVLDRACRGNGRIRCVGTIAGPVVRAVLARCPPSFELFWNVPLAVRRVPARAGPPAVAAGPTLEP